MAKIIIFDTTLRDGEQSPGASMTPAEKLRMAHELEELEVDVIEAGFPISSSDDFNVAHANTSNEPVVIDTQLTSSISAIFSATSSIRLAST